MDTVTKGVTEQGHHDQGQRQLRGRFGGRWERGESLGEAIFLKPNPLSMSSKRFQRKGLIWRTSRA